MPETGQMAGAMTLYSSDVSPFGLRVRLGADAKGQDLRLRPLPDGGVRSQAFLKLNPLGKIPLLVTREGRHIAESAAILGYLEHRFPEPALLPVDAAARACMDAACRAIDLYLMTPVSRLFRQLDPGTRDPRTVADEVGHWTLGAQRLAAVLETADAPVTAPWSLLDCMLAPSLHLSRRIAAMLGLPDDPATVGGLGRRYDAYMAHPAIGPKLRWLTEAQAAYDSRAGRRPVASHH